MDVSNSQLVGWTTILGGIISFVGFICLMLMFVVGGPFGPINDFLAIPSGLLLLPLVFALYRVQAAEQPVSSLLALLAGATGFLATMIGSILLLTGRIDFQTSLIPGIGGFGLIGLFVLINAILSLDGRPLSKGLAWSGMLLAITPSLALISLFWINRIADGLTSMAGQTSLQMHPLMMVMLALGLISYAGLPIWFILVGRYFNQGAVVASVARAVVQ